MNNEAFEKYAAVVMVGNFNSNISVTRFACIVLIVILSISCSKKSPELLKEGVWRGVITIQEQELPFNFVVNQINGKLSLTLINADEQLLIDNVEIAGDSLIATMHLFDTQIRAKINGDKLDGIFIKNYVNDYRLPFKADHGVESRFIKKDENPYQLAKKYKMHFSDDHDSVYAVGLFNQTGSKVKGTVLTTTGDHRYLEGLVDKDSLFLSAFDGEHAYLYKVKVTSDSTITGIYYSGKSFNTSFLGIANDSIELPNTNDLTFLKPGYDKLRFTFPGLDGKPVSLNDEKYKNKVVIVQLLGTWCPNCMDESKFLAPWYEKNKSKGVEIIGLAYEKKDDFEYAKTRLLKMKQRLGIGYDLAFAGSSDKGAASKTLPMLNGVLAYPTTIFVDKKGEVRKIHTGFSGPGTGVYYEKFVEEFNDTVNKLLEEE